MCTGDRSLQSTIKLATFGYPKEPQVYRLTTVTKMAGYHPMYPDFATSQSAVGVFDLNWCHFDPQLSVDQVHTAADKCNSYPFSC